MKKSCKFKHLVTFYYPTTNTLNWFLHEIIQHWSYVVIFFRWGLSINLADAGKSIETSLWNLKLGCDETVQWLCWEYNLNVRWVSGESAHRSPNLSHWQLLIHMRYTRNHEPQHESPLRLVRMLQHSVMQSSHEHHLGHLLGDVWVGIGWGCCESHG